LNVVNKPFTKELIMSIKNIFTNGILVDVNISGWTGEKQLTAEDLGIEKNKIPASFKLGKKALVPRVVLDKFTPYDPELFFPLRFSPVPSEESFR
jgi:hypothetical protein